MKRVYWAFLAGAWVLSGCGLTYIAPRVSDQADGMAVQVVPISAQTLSTANAAPYAPRALPAAFGQVAGGGDLRGMGVLPEPPVIAAQGQAVPQLRLPPPAQSVPYRLGTGDVLRLVGAGALVDPAAVPAAATTPQLTIRDDGAISIPQLGAVMVGGMTIDEAEAAILQRMIESGIDPAFSLEVAGFNSQSVTVGGGVGAASVVPVTLNPQSLAQVLARAGGLQVPDPQLGSIRLYRDGGLYQIPVAAFLDRADLQGLPMLPGDAVFVDQGYDLDRALDFYETQIAVIALGRSDRQAALQQLQTEIGLRRAALDEQRGLFTAQAALDAVDRDHVYLAGEVARPGRWPLPYGRHATLADVLFDSGGPAVATGNPAEIYVLRSGLQAGSVTAWHLDARNAVALTLAVGFLMRPNDIVFIEEQPITTWNRAIEQLLPSINQTRTAIE